MLSGSESVARSGSLLTAVARAVAATHDRPWGGVRADASSYPLLEPIKPVDLTIEPGVQERTCGVTD